MTINEGIPERRLEAYNTKPANTSTSTSTSSLFCVDQASMSIPAVVARWIVFVLPHRKNDWCVDHLEAKGMGLLTSEWKNYF
jgi:hypothetical protein